MTGPEHHAPAAPRVLAVILNWNSGADTIACVEALQRSTYPALRTLVVDNASTDDSVARLRSRFPALPVLELDANYGYAGGNNRGIAHGRAECDFVWLLNPDAIVDPECLVRLVAAAAAYPGAAMLGPLVRMREDRERILSAGGILVHARPLHRGFAGLDRGQFAAPTAVDFVSGCALLVRCAALARIGPLDEDFFVYVEEVDWCCRARTAGFSCVIVPSALAWHPNAAARDVDSPLVTYYIVRNQLLLIRKHRLGWAVLARHLLRHARTLTSWSLRPKWRHKSAQRDALWRALVDFARGRTGAAVELTPDAPAGSSPSRRGPRSDR